MSRPLQISALAVLVTAVTAGHASAAPTVAVDRDCYVPGQKVTMTGSGFTPSSGVRTFFTRLGKGVDVVGMLEFAADPAGAFVEELAAPALASGSVRDQIGIGANDVALVEAGGGPHYAVAFGMFEVTDLNVRVPQWAKAPSRRAKVTVQATGFTLDTGRRLYAHYTRKGKALKTQAVGTLDNGCGDLTATMRQFPAGLRPGRYAVAFNASRTWKKSDFSVKLKIHEARAGAMTRRAGLVLAPSAALTALATTLAWAAAAGASGVTVYGGTVEDGGRFALELTESTGLLAPPGRLTLSTVADCPDEDPSLIVTVNQPIVSPFNIPDGDVLLGDRRPGGRLVATGVRSLQFGGDTGLLEEESAIRAMNNRATGTYRATVQFGSDGGRKCDTGVIRWGARSLPGPHLRRRHFKGPGHRAHARSQRPTGAAVEYRVRLRLRCRLFARLERVLGEAAIRSPVH